MRVMNAKEINAHIRNAAFSAVPDKAEEIWKQPVQEARPDDWYLEGTGKTVKARSGNQLFRIAGVTAACFVLLFLGLFQLFGRTDAVVYLDVNPSVTLDVNRLGKIISADADNDDGRIILDNMDLKGIDVDVAMNALLGSMVKQGYLSQAQNTLLISVNGKNEARTTALRQKLSVNAEQTLETLLGSGIVLGQTLIRMMPQRMLPSTTESPLVKQL